MRPLHTTLAVLLILLGGSSTAVAQATLRLPILEANPSARAAAMGGLPTAKATDFQIYTGAATLFDTPQRLHIGVALEAYHHNVAATNTSGMPLQATIAAAYRIAPQHALMAGFRYTGGESYTLGSSDQRIHPQDWTLDLGYALSIGQHFSADASVGMLQTWDGLAARAMRVALGVTYRTTWEQTASSAAHELYITGRVSDFGTPISYRNGTKGIGLPTHLSLGAYWRMSTTAQHHFAIAATGRYFLHSAQHKPMAIGIGGEYSYQDRIFGRFGYEMSCPKYGFYTAGIGYHFAHFGIDIAYRMANNQTYGINSLLCGITIGI